MAASEGDVDKAAEGTDIRQSLVDLGRIIKNHKKGIFTEHTLIKLLAPSFVKRGKFFLFLSLSPQSTHLDQTIRTLKFGKEAAESHIGQAVKNRD